jgi:hypothetical protein
MELSFVIVLLGWRLRIWPIQDVSILGIISRMGIILFLRSWIEFYPIFVGFRSFLILLLSFWREVFQTILLL